MLSGYRSPAQQLAAAHSYATRVGASLWQLYPNGPLSSSHLGKRYPAGAVDVTDPAGLERALASAPAWVKRKPLVGNGRAIRNDPGHFSRTGH